MASNEWGKEESLSPLERKTRQMTPPLDDINSPLASTIEDARDETSDQPFPFQYLINLFTAPDMSAYLADNRITEDVDMLPIHWQKLISEAKEEVVFERTKARQGLPGGQRRAIDRLERLKVYVWSRAAGDVSNVMSILTELVSNDDELDNILNG